VVEQDVADLRQTLDSQMKSLSVLLQLQNLFVPYL
jgi:hypothetical protein